MISVRSAKEMFTPSPPLPDNVVPIKPATAPRRVTDGELLGLLLAAGINASMDGKKQWVDLECALQELKDRIAAGRNHAVAEKFAVGEIAILVAPSSGHYDLRAEPYIGTEVEIAAAPYRCWSALSGTWYPIRFSDGQDGIAEPQCLRKRHAPPQREAVSTWDDVIVWKPKQVEVTT